MAKEGKFIICPFFPVLYFYFPSILFKAFLVEYGEKTL